MRRNKYYYYPRSVSTRVRGDGESNVLTFDREYGFKPVVYVEFEKSSFEVVTIPFNLCEREFGQYCGMSFDHFVSGYLTMLHETGRDVDDDGAVATIDMSDYDPKLRMTSTQAASILSTMTRKCYVLVDSA
jgi:hypothetical protein